jgi:hypothetical protein
MCRTLHIHVNTKPEKRIYKALGMANDTNNWYFQIFEKTILFTLKGYMEDIIYKTRHTITQINKTEH